MANVIPGNPIDPNFPKYVYTTEPLMEVYGGRDAAVKKAVARVFLGEWMKLLDDPLPEQGRIHVKYRGGKGYVNPKQLGWKRHLEIFFIDVSQGDSILIQTPDDRRVLIDGGESAETFEFIQNKYRLDAADHYVDFDAVVATHSDEDHTKGLIKVLECPQVAVKRFYHNGLFRRVDEAQDPGPRVGDRVFGLVDRPTVSDVPDLTPLMKKIVNAIGKAEKNLPQVVEKMKKVDRWKDRIDLPQEGFVCKRLEAADRYLPPFNDPGRPFSIQVLWPAAEVHQGKLSYPYYEDAGKTVNGNSIVLMARHGNKRILLTGDLNTKSMEEIIKHYPPPVGQGESLLRAEVYKAAHHGSQHFSLDFLKIVAADAAVISSGDERQDVHGHPRAVLLGTVTRYSKATKPAVFSTELAACFKRLSKEEMKQFKKGTKQLYERSIRGIVHLRSDGERLYLGTVHGRKPPKDPAANILWKWDIWPT